MRKLVLCVFSSVFILSCVDKTPIFEKDYCGWRVVNNKETGSGSTVDYQFTLEGDTARKDVYVTFGTYSKYAINDVLCDMTAREKKKAEEEKIRATKQREQEEFMRSFKETNAAMEKAINNAKQTLEAYR